MIIVNIMIKIITMIITATITILKGNNEDYYQHSCCSAVSYDEQNARVSVVYNDHSLYIWDVRDIRKVRLLLFQFSHYHCISGNATWSIFFI